MPSFEGDLSGAEIAAVAAFVSGEEEAATPTPTPAETPSGETGEVTSVPTEDGPDGIAVSGGRVYVTLASAGELQQFDAASGDPVGEPLAVGSQPDNPAVVGDVVWVALSGDDAIARIEGDQIKQIPVGDAPEDIAIAGDSIWVANAGDGTVSRIDRAALRVVGRADPVGPKPLGIAANEDTVWVTSNEDDTVWLLDARTGAVRGKPIAVGSQPRAVAVGGGSAWVANAGDDTVTRVRDRLEIPVGAQPARPRGRRRLGVGRQRGRRHGVPDRRRVRRRRRRPRSRSATTRSGSRSATERSGSRTSARTRSPGFPPADVPFPGCRSAPWSARGACAAASCCSPSPRARRPRWATSSCAASSATSPRRCRPRW